MSGVTEFLHMGGYAFYVWTSYGLTALVLIANVVAPLARRQSIEREQQRRLRAEGRKVGSDGRIDSGAAGGQAPGG